MLGATQAGDATALEALLSRHLGSLRAFVRIRISPALRAQESQSDLVQSVCREVLSYADRFDYQGEAQFKNWLFGAVLHKLASKEEYWRAEKRRSAGVTEFAESQSSLQETYAAFASPSEAAIQAEEIARIEAAFDVLTDEQREVLTLHRFVGLPHREIALQLGKAETAVRMILHRGMARLVSVLED